jgi:D-beta-D-heptose 7-phosphate kinase/D-beta-D-heptose 1-phosphate adenosyltransferase
MPISSNLRCLTKKIIRDYKTLSNIIEGLKAAGYSVVLTIGSWDMLHIGHVRYLNKARDHGDVLVVGVDTDRAIKLYKGELRPVIPGEERCEMLSYQTCVDFITPVDDIDKKGRWGYDLLKKLRPDVFVAVEDSYPQSQLKEIKRYCGRLVVLPRQAANTSTTRFIQGTIKKQLDQMYKLVEKRR